MNIYINNTQIDVEENINLAVFFDKIEENTNGIAVAINNIVIPKNSWKDTVLQDKDEIILIKIASGG